MSRRLLLMNVNTTEAITTRLFSEAQHVASQGTTIDPIQPRWGVSSVESAYDAYISVAAGLDLVHDLIGAGPNPRTVPWDAMIWGGFGDPGSEAFEDLLNIPVFDLARSAAKVASARFGNYAVLSTVARMTPLIHGVLRSGDYGQACTGIYTLDLPVTNVATQNNAALVELLVPLAHRARADGAQSVCLGSGALAGLGDLLAAASGCEVVDGLSAAVSLAEETDTAFWRESRQTQPLSDKPRPGWPRGGN